MPIMAEARSEAGRIFRLATGAGRLATLTFDLPGKKVNVFTRTALEELEQVIGEVAARHVVIGDDDIDARCTEQGDGRDSGGSAVTGDDHARASFVRGAHSRLGEIVSVLQPARDERHGDSAESANRAGHEGSRAHSVDVVITVNENRLAVPDCAHQALDRPIEIEHRSGRVEMVQAWTEKTLRGFSRGVSAGDQQPADALRQVERLGERRDDGGIWRGRKNPARGRPARGRCRRGLGRMGGGSGHSPKLPVQ